MSALPMSLYYSAFLRYPLLFSVLKISLSSVYLFLHVSVFTDQSSANPASDILPPQAVSHLPQLSLPNGSYS